MSKSTASRRSASTLRLRFQAGRAKLFANRVGWATPHALRHGLASLMAERGYSPAQIAAHLGHADGGVIALRTYIHADPVDAADFIDDALKGGA
jgi:integrase